MALVSGLLLIHAVLFSASLHAQPDAKASGNAQSASVSEPDTTIFYTARDSLLYNLGEKTMELWGEASITYEETKLEAPRIVIDYTTSVFDAFAAKDSLGEFTELPVFTDKDGGFEAEHMKYNYATRRGRTLNVSSEIKEGYYTGSDVKRLETGELYIQDGIYSTCPKDDPDFWFYGKEMKIIPGDKVVARPLILYIRPKPFSLRFPPVPLIPLPFMFFSIDNERSSGFLVPRFNEDERGIYFSNLGYFWAFDDYMDFRLEGDLAFNGSWRLGERLRYRKRYLFEGYLEGEYERYILSHPDDPDYTDYSNWNAKLVHRHRFDPTARLDLNLMYQGGRRYYDINSINPQSIINEQVNSYATLSKTFGEGKRSLTAGYQRSQDLRDDDLSQSVTLSYYQNRFYPFRNDDTPSDDWRSRFSLTPTASAQAQYATREGLFYSDYLGKARLRMAYQQDFSRGYKANFSQSVNFEGKIDNNPVDDDRWGTRLELPFSVMSTLFRYFNVNGNLNFNHYYVNSFIEKRYDAVTDEVITETRDDPTHFYTYALDLDAQTRLYGTLYSRTLEDMIGVKALRHTVIPTLTYTYNPDFTKEKYGYYGTYLDAANDPVRYNKFQNSLYSNVFAERSALGISFQNLLQAKVKGKRSSSRTVPEYRQDKILQLLSLTASTSYNFAADSLRLAPLTLSASSNALAPDFLLRAGATYDFYDFDPVTGDRIDRFYVRDGKGLLRFVQGFVNMSLNLNGHLKNILGGEENDEKDDQPDVQEALYKERFERTPYRYGSASLPWHLRLSLYLNSSKYQPLEPAKTTALLNTSAGVSVSKVWDVRLNTGYDIKNSELIFPQINLYGDYGCWDVSLQWVPAGEYRSYFFQIGIKAPYLRDIRFRQRGRLGDAS